MIITVIISKKENCIRDYTMQLNTSYFVLLKCWRRALFYFCNVLFIRNAENCLSNMYYRTNMDALLSEKVNVLSNLEKLIERAETHRNPLVV